ncbi:hypothetical protein SAMN05216358_0090 [Rhizobium sp. AN5]|uniref:hypothetical protein n=1 Tax=Rhizobium sp. AN5 TaxID=1855304 RepID=UPI000BC52672|nr:hypothetical protein [Rhizobium sp. AN5]SOC90071.1 hypothetical protein SAMN05216358_0090 [Rhizobium sp. AN5]
MNVKSLLLAGLIVAAGFASNQALALDDRDLSDFACRDYGAQSTRCEPHWKVNERREVEYQQKVLPFLKKNGYPSEIRVEDPDMMKAVKAGWGVRKNCYKLPAGAATGDKSVDKAKAVYCLVKERGFKIAPPKIVAAY